jgi:hypothetical protein
MRFIIAFLIGVLTASLAHAIEFGPGVMPSAGGVYEVRGDGKLYPVSPPQTPRIAQPAGGPVTNFSMMSGSFATSPPRSSTSPAYRSFAPASRPLATISRPAYVAPVVKLRPTLGARLQNCPNGRCPLSR